jgi:FKBP-type peptidyl-prolyl cis-trans isomerase FklB
MRNTFTTSLTLVAASMMFVANAPAQQTPAAKSSQAPPANAPKTPAGKPHQTPGAKTAAPLSLKTQKEKASYAIGLNIGKSLHRDSVDVDPSILARGLKDALAGGKTLLTDDEVKAALTALQLDMRKKQEEKMQIVGDTNKKTGEAFLAANKAKDGVVTLPSGLQYKVLKEGAGPKPSVTDSVVCNYKGTLIDSTEFDSSYKRGEPVTFPVNGVIKGWTEALQLMPVGSKWQLFVPSELAYGQRGPSPEIGPNSTLVFEVELLSIQPKAAAAAPETPGATVPADPEAVKPN